MDELNDLEKNFNNAINKLSEAVNLYANSISKDIRNLKDKNERVTYLNNMKVTPSIKVLKKVNEIAITRQDYETCQALNEYANSRGLIL